MSPPLDRPAGTHYVGRFAPSPSGPLHRGSVVAALASYVDARAHGGLWRVRIEDVDLPRAVPGADRVILGQLEALGMRADGEIWWQSRRNDVYAEALALLRARGLAYGCACTRRELRDAALPVSPVTGEPPYPGTCRNGLLPGRLARAWRYRVEPGEETFIDRWFGEQRQDVAREVGDFVIRRADGLWAYQLAVVVDDIAQGITDVVRGADLLASTARQRRLHRELSRPPLAATAAPPPRTLHVPLITDGDGRKLSKQNGAPAADTARPLEELQLAWKALGFARLPASDVTDFHRQALEPWHARFRPA
ncbi:MAG: tRNA glutamyl-Q(34) synthetase GluQRS [Pigmentiphaga sp.]|nr:tRNA glutamyl-Q(34) synthetase GluQRS [Pigmentiphaga sp.]